MCVLAYEIKTSKREPIVQCGTDHKHWFVTTRAARVLLFPAISVCVSVCQRDNSRTVRDIITKFLRKVERADKFANGRTRR